METYITRYVHKKSIKLLSLYSHELLEKIEEHEEKSFLIVDNYMLEKLLEKIKEIIGIDQFDDTKVLIKTDVKLPDGITFKNVVILMKCVI